MSIIGGDVESVSGSVPSSTSVSAPGTPRNRVKFLCSHGGKILPRPADGHLKYVGGETRVICVPRDITFPELMKKLTSMIDGEMILKYQLMPEDLDALVTVKSDEDLHHMIEECDRHELLGTPRLRAFLFPVNLIVFENQMGPMDRHSREQRYINSVNGIPSPIYSTFKPLPINTSYTTFSISSACSSPRTPPETTSTATSCVNLEITTLHGKLSSLPRNHSSPSLCNLLCNSPINHQNPILIASPNMNQSHQQNAPNHHHNHVQQQPQPHHFHSHSLPHSHPHPHLHPHPPPQIHQSPKPPLDCHPHKTFGPEHLVRTRSTCLADNYRHQTDHAPTHNPRMNRGGHMFYQRGSPYDDYYGTDSPPGSPLARSPSVLSPSPSIRSGRS